MTAGLLKAAAILVRLAVAVAAVGGINAKHGRDPHVQSYVNGFVTCSVLLCVTAGIAWVVS